MNRLIKTGLILILIILLALIMTGFYKTYIDPTVGPHMISDFVLVAVLWHVIYLVLGKQDKGHG